MGQSIAVPERKVISWTTPGGVVEMAFRLLPARTFRMGSRGHNPDEEPVHEAKIVQDFWLAETPVTQAQFALWTEAEGIEHEHDFGGHPDHPAENVDWHQANAYGAWLTQTKGQEFPGLMACLPTEAEWEHACRSGTEPDYYNGDEAAALAEAG